ncbi:MAG: NAD(P)H-binding protein [Actinomycetota bacterium]|nr:NAD(P)H-binding protein [Actinomycetota bacterium]
MTVLVTGANGNLGRLTVLNLLERGAEPGTLVATARDLTSIKDLADLGVETRAADYDDPASLDPAFAGVDRVLLVSSNAVGQRLDQHRNVVDAAVRQGVSLVAYTSVLRADTTTLALADDHLATERYLAETGVPHLLLRNGWYLENYTENITPALQSGAVHGAAGGGRVSAAARADYAEAAAVALLEGTPGQVLELGGDDAFTMAEYAAALTVASGTDVVYNDLPPEQYAAVLESVGVPAPMAQILADCDRGIAAGDLLDTTGTLSGIIGRPTTPLAVELNAALA